MTNPPILAGARAFGRYIVYVDESGDHGLETLDPHYPVFVLAFCVFEKDHYAQDVAPALGALKFRYFGHDTVVLHERDIRRERGAFRFVDRIQKQRFIDALTTIIDASDFALISCAIDKAHLREKAPMTGNPYHLALGSCLQTLYTLLVEQEQVALTTHIVVEARGKREDRELESEFQRICSGANPWGKRLPFEIVFADKKTNSCGLQLADLVARPIGMALLRPSDNNRAFNVLKRKLYRAGRRLSPESEKPR